ncbi:MAG: hypothetical protein A2W91_09835 [Bacteroidetes bacterium GWF2_38_335]|nr:MAG: hypothetical protein A2W91_09835 [Bacteroidetes bacterium GWF2_38_335]HBS88072.1 hypothetical protein [Bacteroidales bacterium]
MKYLTLITLFLIFLSASAQEINKSYLTGSWIDSFEEKEEGFGGVVLRPYNFKYFPQAWFRFSINLEKDSECSWLVLAPDDAHYFKTGTWTFDEGTNEIKVNDKEGNLCLRFLVVFSDINLLILKPVYSLTNFNKQ